VEFLGTGSVGSDYLDVIARRGAEDEVADALAAQIERTRELTDGPFGVNLFVPGTQSSVDLDGYMRRLDAEAQQYGVRPGEPRWDDDDYPAKLELVARQRIPMVSCTFGLPAPEDVARLREAGSTVVVTVTSPDEALRAAQVGADALCVQGFEAGAHRGLIADDPAHPAGGELYGLLAALRMVSSVVDLPLIGAGGLVHGADVAGRYASRPPAGARGGRTCHGIHASIQRPTRPWPRQPVPRRAFRARARCVSPDAPCDQADPGSGGQGG
jgi:nitronate monooxygenase